LILILIFLIRFSKEKADPLVAFTRLPLSYLFIFTKIHFKYSCIN